MKIDTILNNGAIYTGDPNRPFARSVGIHHGVVIGLDDDLSGVEAVTYADLGGRCTVPGFNDAHMHFSTMGVEMSQLDVSYTAAESLDALYGLVEEHAASLSADAWVIGHGYDQNRIGGHPDLRVLDTITGGRPAYLLHNSHHMAVVNSPALAAAGIDAAEHMVVPPGGDLGRDSDGRFTGLLLERAMTIVSSAIWPLELETIVSGIGAASEWAVRNGLTSATEPGLGGDVIGNSAVDFRAFQVAHERGLLDVRMTLMPYITAFHELGGSDRPEGWGIDLGLRSGFGDRFLRLGPVKMLTDGSLIGRTAATCCEYRGEPGNRGLLQWEGPEIEQLIVDAHVNGWQVAAHAIGDRSLNHVLDGVEKAQAKLYRPDHRHRIEHAAIVSPEQVERIARLGMVPVPQGKFISTLGDGFLEALEDDQHSHIYRMQSFLDAGVCLPGSSDAPVVAGEPLQGIHDMVNRKTTAGRVLGESERVTVSEAVRAYTFGSAFAVHEGDVKGVLAPGYLADLVVLSDDIFTIAAERIGELEVIATMVNGSFVFDSAIQ
ncbi:amidohydrolase [Brevibacterium album]|uniref:amidohydrolase n=1 Tax=Brevibacterium album TaxID=417948 RepID=UPI00048C6ACB|nr:amidohydrolase [Brevibacterium album]